MRSVKNYIPPNREYVYPSKVISFRICEDLLAEVDAVAEIEGLTRNGYINKLLFENVREYGKS